MQCTLLAWRAYIDHTTPHRHQSLLGCCPPSQIALNSCLLCSIILAANDEWQIRKGCYDLPGGCVHASNDLMRWALRWNGLASADMYLVAWYEPTQQPALAPIVFKHPLKGHPQPCLAKIRIDAVYKRRGDACVWVDRETTFKGTPIVACMHTVMQVVGEEGNGGAYLDWSIEQVYAMGEGISLRLCSPLDPAEILPTGSSSERYSNGPTAQPAPVECSMSALSLVI